MISIEIIAAGKLKDTTLLELYKRYSSRINRSPILHEIDAQTSKKLTEKYLSYIDNTAYLVALDEHGLDYSSKNLADKLEQLPHSNYNKVQFFIGAADGLPQIILDKVDLKLSFSSLTWPHMLVRVMLLEQLYRAQQIITGHPYHKD